MAKKKISARAKANMKWASNNIRQIKFSFHNEKDSDIIEKLDSVENKQGYVKDLIRSDIAKEHKGE